VSKLLIDEPPLKLLASLALKINKSPALALVLQKIHYEKSKSNQEEYLITYPKLHERIPFISIPQLKRIIVQLVNINLIDLTKSKNQMLGSKLIINYEKLLKWGFKCTDDGSIINLINEHEKPLLILPTIAKEFGITAAGIIQQLNFNIIIYEKESIWLTYSEINTWAPFICKRLLREIFYKFEKDNLILSKLSDIQNNRSGKFYSVNHQEVKMKFEKPIANLFVDNNVPIINNIFEKSVDKPIPITNTVVDKNISSDHFCHPVEIISATQLRSFLPPNSIDQRSKKIFKENNTNILGLKPDCGTIPTMKDKFVCLKNKLLTFEISEEKASNLINKFGQERIDFVLIKLSENYDKLSEKLIGAALDQNWKWPSKKSEGAKVIGHIKPEDSTYRRYLEENTRLALQAISSVRKSSDDVESYYINLIRQKLPNAVPESTRHGARNVIDLNSSSEA
jgi:hypothetical protein